MTAQQLEDAASPDRIVRAQASAGGTAPEAVAAMHAELSRQATLYQERIAAQGKRCELAYEACREIARSASNARSAEDFRTLVSSVKID